MTSKSLFFYDLKKGKKLAKMYVIALLALFALLLGSLAVWHHFFNPKQDLIGADGMPKTPLELYVPSTYETFDCLADGPNGCQDWSENVDRISSSPVEFTFQPAGDAGADVPGQPNPDGTQTVRLDDSLSDAQWVALGESVTRDGQVDPGQFTRENITVTGSSAQAELADSSAGAPDVVTIGFDFSGGADDPTDVRVTSVLYEEG